jgi:hypothetical protein
VKSLEKVVAESFETLRDRASRKGLWLAIGAGVGVAAPVAYFFLVVLWNASFLAPTLGPLAFACTFAGALLAVRAKTAWRALGWVFLSNVLPPTLVCAPTVIGMMFSTPSGLVAFALVLPFVYLARWSARRERGHEERERLLGALFAALSAIGIVVASAILVPDAGPQPPFAVSILPALVASLTALGLALSSLARDVGRAVLVMRAKSEGWRVHATDRGTAVLERVFRIGGGPLREAETSEHVGEIEVAVLRTALSAIASLALALIALAGFGVLILGL